MENRKNYIEPENKQIIMKKWKNNKDKLISSYKEFLKRDIEGKEKPHKEYETRSSIVSPYYYDNSDSEIGKVINFFIFVYENDIDFFLRLSAFNTIIDFASNTNQRAIEYIHLQSVNSNINKKDRLRFYIVNLAFQKEEKNLDYLNELIKKAQAIETTDIKYNSSIEQVIISSLSKYYIPIRYHKGYSYTSALPLIKQLIYSRSASVQKTACFQYHYHTNNTEIKKIFNKCWSVVQDESTSRIDYLNALYGLQALYGLSERNYVNHKISFKGISSYFIRFGGKNLIDGKWIYVPSEKIKRLTKDEITYFHQRFKIMRLP